MRIEVNLFNTINVYLLNRYLQNGTKKGVSNLIHPSKFYFFFISLMQRDMYCWFGPF